MGALLSLTLTVICIYGGFRVIKLGLKGVAKLFDALDDWI